MDKFIESSSKNYNDACGPSRFQQRVFDENRRAAQAQRVNPQFEEALHHLSIVIF